MKWTGYSELKGNVFCSGSHGDHDNRARIQQLLSAYFINIGAIIADNVA